MKIQEQILINKYGQDLIDIEQIAEIIGETNEQKKTFLNDILFFIQQSKPIVEDIDLAIERSKLRATFTPCVMLKKGVANYNLDKFKSLPDNEINKTIILLLNLFKIAYARRFEYEKNNPNKWWYWDLSDYKKINEVLQMYS